MVSLNELKFRVHSGTIEKNDLIQEILNKSAIVVPRGPRFRYSTSQQRRPGTYYFCKVCHNEYSAASRFLIHLMNDHKLDGLNKVDEKYDQVNWLKYLNAFPGGS